MAMHHDDSPSRSNLKHSSTTPSVAGDANALLTKLDARVEPPGGLRIFVMSRHQKEQAFVVGPDLFSGNSPVYSCLF